MPLRVHALMEDADDLYAIQGGSVKHDMFADVIFPVAFADVVTRPPLLWMNYQTFESAVQIQNILVGLFLAPSFEGVVPDRF